MRARAKIVETKRRYEATISLDEIRKKFNIPTDATVTAIATGVEGQEPEFLYLQVSYERVK